MKTRTLKELYRLLSRIITEDSYFMCHGINRLYRSGKINLEEKDLLQWNFTQQRPSEKKHVEFYKLRLINEPHYLAFDCWFDEGSNREQLRVRRRFIKAIIKTL